MTRTISLDPVTRIEGHLAVECDFDGDSVTDARVAGRMFRGFEDFLIGRHPVDAARITQRICGICHEVHGIAASMALEDLYGHRPPPNGLVLRELILGLHLITDHIFHFYHLTLPDYLDFSRLKRYRGADPRVAQLERMFLDSSGTFTNPGLADPLKDTELTVELALAYAEAIAIRKEAGSGLASLGGKVPFCHAILPGGVTTDVTSDRLMKYADALDKTADFIKRYYLPHAQLLASHFSRYFSIGGTHGNFYCNGGFDRHDQPLYKSGVVFADGRRERFDAQRVGESVERSFFADDGQLAAKKAGAYSWVKALHYGGQAMEVGPLARLAVNPDQGFTRFINSFKQQRISSSVMGRILARAYEAERISVYLLGLLPSYRLEEPTISQIDMTSAPSGSGRAGSLAARGALNHELKVEAGRVVSYQLQVPSTWNFGPSAHKVRGTVEQALVGTRIDLGRTPHERKHEAIEIGRIVRSFDPCLACAIH